VSDWLLYLLPSTRVSDGSRLSNERCQCIGARNYHADDDNCAGAVESHAASALALALQGNLPPNFQVRMKGRSGHPYGWSEHLTLKTVGAQRSMSLHSVMRCDFLNRHRLTEMQGIQLTVLRHAGRRKLWSHFAFLESAHSI